MPGRNAPYGTSLHRKIKSGGFDHRQLYEIRSLQHDSFPPVANICDAVISALLGRLSMSENRGGLHAGYKAGGLAAFAVLAAAGLAPETLAPETLAYQAEPASHTLTVIGTYATGSFDEGASEVVAHDPRTQRIFVINADASRVDVLDMSKPTTLRLDFSIDVADDVGAHGGVNGVDVAGGLVAVAVENGDSALDGFVAFYDTGGAFIGTVTVGNLPDAVKFSPDGDTVVVANEGEPVGDGADPEGLLVDPPGSISIINTADVPTLVATLDFSHFDGREAEFAAKGVKIQPGKSLSEDMEPEHAAFSADGDAVFVTLQEANSFAVVDLTVPRITDIVPLGFKDHSGGQPHLETFLFGDLPLLGTDAAGLDINLGGFSGLAFEGESGAGVLSFMTVPDRGPNGGEVVGGKRTFNLPEYQAAIFFFEVDERAGEAAILDGRTIPLTRDGNMPITGLPNIPGFDEEPVDAAGTAVPYDPFGADLEGIVRDPLDGSFWMVDEYRPAIYHFDADGDLIVRLVPVGTSALAPAHVQAAAHGIPAGMIVPGFYGEERLPEVYNNHRTNRGFEAIAFDEDARRLYAFVQSPMDNPDNSTRDSSVLRILEVDVNPDSSAYLDPVAEYVQLLERPSHAMNTAVDKIGDAILVGPGRFLVIERDGTVDAGGKKYVFEVDIGHATNILGTLLSDRDTGMTLEAQSPDSLSVRGIAPAAKAKILNLPSVGYIPSDKPEGMALLPDGRIAVLNDNDFGIGDSAGFAPVLGIISFDGRNALDASDRDAAINIQSWPVLGLYMPDSIDSFEAGGSTFYVTANEGDSRDYGFFSEETRVKDVTLNPEAFPDAEHLQMDENLGRLKITTTLGDGDGDGEFERLFSYGGRSFSIWDSFGNLVYDSGDDLERIVSGAHPDDFNADNDENGSFDDRSDDKGPEPEGIEIGVVGSRTLAFVGLERVGGVVVYDVSDPYGVKFLDYVNNRNFGADVLSGDSPNPAAGDLGPEGLHFVSAADSPTASPLLIVGNEVSGTTTIYRIDIRE